MKNTKLFLAIIGIFAVTLIFSSCDGDANFKKLIIGKFQGNLDDNELKNESTFNFKEDGNVTLKAVISPQNSPEPMKVTVEVEGKYSIVDGYLFIDNKSLTVDPESMKANFEKDFIGVSYQYKIATLDDKELKLESEKEKLLLKRLK